MKLSQWRPTDGPRWWNEHPFERYQREEEEEERRRREAEEEETMSERDIQDALNAWLEKNRPNWLVLNPPMGKKSAFPVGWPDFTIFTDDGRCILIETKTMGGRIRPEQDVTHRKLLNLNQRAYVCWNIEDCIQVLTQQVTPARAPQGLCIYGNALVLKSKDGAMTHVRRASEEDRRNYPEYSPTPTNLKHT